MKAKAQIAAGLILLLCAAATAYGQTACAGTITGTVRDPSSAIVPGASVVVRNTDTGIERSLQTNEAGIYVAPFVQPRHYEITVSKAGFGKVVRQNLTLQVGQTLTIDFAVAVQTTAETVLVTGQAGVQDSYKPQRTQA